ncbi:hypothetical protein SBFV2_gp55 [Sulfolobales Beppu filamentous virus 2]|uniref:Uncharacterized protein n=1 Tax=Sulfolobales Beppu filamentous virus 2 TaxID=2493123 RepID=A0A3Q8Q9V2_9VIRU|nr:hypothetical protein HOU84_gp55 [Sulfolobales Beppu filamentous virus 2]AZI75822.1 hypothetical protein SBFV2_gp55 [Sulfolobales Beppu filamentous virus 2]
MTVTSDFIALANDLVIRGYKSAQGYVSGLTTQPTFYIVLLNNGSVVAQLPVSGFQYREISPNQQTLTYIAIDNSGNTYTFDEVQLWAGNQYIITDDTLQQPVSKQQTIPISVTITLTLETSTNTTTSTGTVLINNVKLSIPANSFWSYTPCKAITLPMPVQNFIILLLLIPTAYYVNLGNTLFMQTYNQLPLDQQNPLSSINGVTTIAVALPQVIKERSLATTVAHCTTATPTTVFKPPFNTTDALIGAFVQITTINIAFITISQSISTTQYVEFLITTVVST